ncbi:MAG: hypothetical protein ACJZ57_10880 [Candidatus Poriferisodalaceae bacterium]
MNNQIEIFLLHGVTDAKRQDVYDLAYGRTLVPANFIIRAEKLELRENAKSGSTAKSIGIAHHQPQSMLTL